MWALGKALWSQTPWEMTRDERGGELMFHYVRRQIRRCTTGFRRPLIGVRRALRSIWDQDEMIMCIDRITPVSFYLSLQLPYALSHFHSKIILHEQIIILNLLATANRISLCFGWVWCRWEYWILAIFYSVLLPLLLVFCVGVLLLIWPREQRASHY